MQKDLDNLDDYNDHTPSPLLEETKCYVVQAILFLVSLAVIFAVAGVIQG